MAQTEIKTFSSRPIAYNLDYDDYEKVKRELEYYVDDVIFGYDGGITMDLERLRPASMHNSSTFRGEQIGTSVLMEDRVTMKRVNLTLADLILTEIPKGLILKIYKHDGPILADPTGIYEIGEKYQIN
jgi:hypothetical protein